MPFKYTVDSSSITEQDVKNAYGNMYKNSDKAKETINTIIDDGQGIGPDKDIYQPSFNANDPLNVQPKTWTQTSWDNEQIIKYPNDPQNRKDWPFDCRRACNIDPLDG